jgi:5'-nucleotidase
MRFLVTNDDGIDAPGLDVLVRVARRFGEVRVVAPHVCHSSRSHAVNLKAPFRIEPSERFEGVTAFSCGGSPADCVRVGLRHLPIGPMDLVLSGINSGGNIGVDLYYSGTVAAAREAALLGVQAIAISQLVRPGQEIVWSQTQRRANHVLRLLLERPQRLPLLTNVNLPSPEPGRPERGVIVCPLALEPWPMRYERDADDSSAAHGAHDARYAGRYLDRAASDGSDFYYLTRDYTTITPLVLDLTATDRIDNLLDDRSGRPLWRP